MIPENLRSKNLQDYYARRDIISAQRHNRRLLITEEERVKERRKAAEWRVTHKEWANEHCKNNLRKTRLKVFTHYGNKCACCGETTFEFLQIDHINKDGKNHRKELNGRRITYWLKKNNYPEGFQLLCGSCHSAKSHYGSCPHEHSKM